MIVRMGYRLAAIVLLAPVRVARQVSRDHEGF
jgi:hypothetical protein